MVRIGLDFDGVIADTIPSMVAYAREHMQLDLLPEECVTPGGPLRLGVDAYREFVRATHATPFALAFRPTNGTLDSLPRLGREHDLVIVTARESAALDNAKRWLDDLGLARCIAAVHSSFGPTKSKLVGTLDLDCFVDDIPSTFEAWPGGVSSLLWDASYNRSVSPPASVERIHGWSGLAAWLARR